MTSLESFNTLRCQLIIHTLYEQGVQYFCLSPGSRSTPLALAIGNHPNAKKNISIHFDERGLGFHALGLAKGSKSPVAILVTTGTAVANLFPAIMEAYLSRIPLVLLTADRPPELRDCGSNQTADHIKFFGSFTRWDIDLAVSDPLASDAYLISSLAYAVEASRRQPAGPVQVNCMIREPFIHPETLSISPPTPCLYEVSESMPLDSSFAHWAKLLSHKQKGVLVLGSDALTPEELPSFLQLCELFNWPILSDVISGGRGIGTHPHHIEYAELLLKTRSFSDLKVDAILQIGNRIVSKPLSQWIQKQPSSSSYFLVVDHPMRQDPFHKVSHRMECSTQRFCQGLIRFLPQKEDKQWILLWKQSSLQIKDKIAFHFQKEKKEKNQLSEPAVFHFLAPYTQALPIFLSNSMPVRDAELLFYPEGGASHLFCNRGASGIDGNIATATGLAKSLPLPPYVPLIALLGDLASLHDVNSFSLASKIERPILFIIMNNQGGGIFSFLPVAEKKELFEEFIATAHDYSFSHIAKTFSLDFFSIDSWHSWESAFHAALQAKTSCILECRTNRSTNVSFHQVLSQIAQECLCSSYMDF